MKKTHARAHIRLMGLAEVAEFIQTLNKLDDAFSIENRSCAHRVNAKSIMSVMHTMFEFPEEMYLVNDSRDGVMPAVIDPFRMPA